MNNPLAQLAKKFAATLAILTIVAPTIAQPPQPSSSCCCGPACQCPHEDQAPSCICTTEKSPSADTKVTLPTAEGTLPTEQSPNLTQASSPQLDPHPPLTDLTTHQVLDRSHSPRGPPTS
ncbi:hypothetical protein CCB80_00685 [Armatimonadetes bacterium Uphvl-Ar1]|nr:hypothetical protein CCB80_00685 [Armatimonadetes bacterium Uphvl-Ar1]